MTPLLTPWGFSCSIGYPRTLVQVDELDRMININGHSLDAVVLLAIDQGEIIQRLLRRASIDGRADDNETVSGAAWGHISSRPSH